MVALKVGLELEAANNAIAAPVLAAFAETAGRPRPSAYIDKIHEYWSLIDKYRMIFRDLTAKVATALPFPYLPRCAAGRITPVYRVRIVYNSSYRIRTGHWSPSLIDLLAAGASWTFEDRSDATTPVARRKDS